MRSRNLRLTEPRTFLKYAVRWDVTALHTVERAMAVPMKRFERPLLGHLTRPEMLAVLGQPGSDWTSQRDHLLLAMLYNTGARVSEIVGVRVVDVVLDGSACVHLHGKGRRERAVPLWKSTVLEVRAWLQVNAQLRGDAALIPNRDGHAMTRCNVAHRLALAVDRAAQSQPNLTGKHVSPHTLNNLNTYAESAGRGRGTIVPLAMELVALDRKGRKVFVGDLGASLVGVLVQLGADAQALLGGHAADELDHDLARQQRPLASAGRVM